MKCPGCGAFNPDGFQKCGVCSSELRSPSPAPAASQPVVPALTRSPEGAPPTDTASAAAPPSGPSPETHPFSPAHVATLPPPSPNGTPPPLPAFEHRPAAPFMHGDPPAARRWNWGAFLIPLPWGIAHRVWIGVLSVIPLVGLGVKIWMGATGGRRAWQNKQWRSPSHFEETQRIWAWIGLGVRVFLVVPLLLVSIAIPTFLGARQRAIERQATGPPKVITSDDGKVDLTTPSSWIKVDDHGNPDATLVVSDARDNAGVVVIVEPKSDFDNISLQQYADFVTMLTQEGLTQGTVTEGPAEVVISGHPGIRRELRGSIDGVNFVYLLTVFATPVDFVQVLTVAVPSQFEVHRRAMEDVAGSIVVR